ncbi:hypothetical protein LZ32DRAFT_383065 [Colletotrichum eremochloae]|nr:hypothetical protein LZ32DRAFT_383065 [Colletotrichum eremochloae]
MSANEDVPGAAAGSNNQVTRAADWTPPNAWADEIDRFSSSIDNLWYKIREKKDELAGGQATQKELDKQFHEEWADCVTAGYRSLHRVGLKRSSIEYTIYLGLKKMYLNTYGIDSATWREENQFPSPRKSTRPFDDGYTEWLRINKETASTQPADSPATKVTNPSPAPHREAVYLGREPQEEGCFNTAG